MFNQDEGKIKRRGWKQGDMILAGQESRDSRYLFVLVLQIQTTSLIMFFHEFFFLSKFKQIISLLWIKTYLKELTFYRYK